MIRACRKQVNNKNKKGRKKGKKKKTKRKQQDILI
jgi:hypothetical protein